MKRRKNSFETTSVWTLSVGRSLQTSNWEVCDSIFLFYKVGCPWHSSCSYHLNIHSPPDLTGFDLEALLSQNSTDLLELLATQKQGESSSSQDQDTSEVPKQDEDNKLIARIDSNLRHLSKCAMMATQSSQTSSQTSGLPSSSTSLVMKKEEPTS